VSFGYAPEGRPPIDVHGGDPYDPWVPSASCSIDQIELMPRDPFPVFLISILNSCIGWFCLPFITVATWIIGTTRAKMRPVHERPAFYHDMAKGWGSAICRSLRLRVHVEGREHLDSWLESGAAVIVCNHNSLMDIPALLDSLPGRFNFVAKAEVFRVPLLGEFIRRAGYISLIRGDRKEATRSLDNAAKALEDGWSPLLFAEGTRSFDGKLQRFKRGAILLAARTQRPILPMAIVGMHEQISRNCLVCRPGEVTIRVGAPFMIDLDLDSASEETIQQVVEQVRSRVANLLDPSIRKTYRIRERAVKPLIRPELRRAFRPAILDDL